MENRITIHDLTDDDLKIISQAVNEVGVPTSNYFLSSTGYPFTYGIELIPGNPWQEVPGLVLDRCYQKSNRWQKFPLAEKVANNKNIRKAEVFLMILDIYPRINLVNDSNRESYKEYYEALKVLVFEEKIKYQS